MNIGIIGAGKIGSTVARLFAEAGHDVAVSNSRGAESLESVVKDLGGRVRGMSVAEAATFGEVVMLAVPFRNPEALPPPETVNGKIVIDAMNAYAAPGGAQLDLGSQTSSEQTRQRLPGARLVKAFNTVWFKHLAETGRKDLPVAERRAVFLSGDDDEAKRTVKKLIEEIGFGPVDLGSLAQGGRRQQPDSPVYNKVMTAREGASYAAAAQQS